MPYRRRDRTLYHEYWHALWSTTVSVKLEANLIDLHDRIHGGADRALLARRVFIPELDGRQRPLASCPIAAEGLMAQDTRLKGFTVPYPLKVSRVGPPTAGRLGDHHGPRAELHALPAECLWTEP
jgi:hypothetical protein